MSKPIILHMFNTPVNNIDDNMLATISHTYTHIMISPIQFSADHSEWWYRYQPLDYTIGGPIGSKEDIQKFTSRAWHHNLYVIVDVVFNHMSDWIYNGYSYNFPNKDVLNRHTYYNDSVKAQIPKYRPPEHKDYIFVGDNNDTTGDFIFKMNCTTISAILMICSK